MRHLSTALMVGTATAALAAAMAAAPSSIPTTQPAPDRLLYAAKIVCGTQRTADESGLVPQSYDLRIA